MRTGKGRGVVRIHQDRCTGCGQCVSVCRAGCLDFAESLNARGDLPARYLGTGCLGDGACARVCPEQGAREIHQESSPSPAGFRAAVPA